MNLKEKTSPSAFKIETKPTEQEENKKRRTLFGDFKKVASNTTIEVKRFTVVKNEEQPTDTSQKERLELLKKKYSD